MIYKCLTSAVFVVSVSANLVFAHDTTNYDCGDLMTTKIPHELFQTNRSYFFKYGSNYKNRPILMIPGGPWISGQYLDSLAKDLSKNNDTVVYRTILPNHEIDSGKNPEMTFEELVGLLKEAYEDIERQHLFAPIFIGHSYGTIIIGKMLKILKNLPPQVVLISTPLSLSDWPKFRSKLNTAGVPLATNVADADSFKIWWQAAAPLYFLNNEVPVEHKVALLQETYMLGNEKQAPGVDDTEKLFRELAVYAARNQVKISNLEGSDDPIGKQSNLETLKEIFREVYTIPNSGHFPMIENPIATAQILDYIINRTNK